MTIVEMLRQSGVLSLLGMGVVFGFLVIMIIAVSIVARLIHVLGLDTDLADSAGVGVSRVADNSAEITAAITAAVNEYRR